MEQHPSGKRQRSAAAARVKRQRSQEWRQRKYSSSDEEPPATSSSIPGYREEYPERNPTAASLLNNYADRADPSAATGGLSLRDLNPGKAWRPQQDVGEEEASHYDANYINPVACGAAPISQDFSNPESVWLCGNAAGLTHGPKDMQFANIGEDAYRIDPVLISNQIGRSTLPNSEDMNSCGSSAPGSPLHNSDLTGPIPSLGPTLTSLPPHVVSSYQNSATLPLYDGTVLVRRYKSSPQYLDRIKSRCSWKLAAICLLLTSALLLGIVVYLIALTTSHQSLEGECLMFKEDSPFGLNSQSRYELPGSPSPNVSSTSLRGSVTPTEEVVFSIPKVWYRWPAITPVHLNDFYQPTIQPIGYWNSEVLLITSGYVWFNLSIPSTANLAFFGRRNVAPTVTQYDFFDFINSGHITTSDHERVRSKRSFPQSNVTMLRFLNSGKWYVSVFNDDLEEVKISFTMGTLDLPVRCPNDCSGHGTCSAGYCECEPTYEGLDCSKSACSVLCSNRGQYLGGMCHCDENWKGAECDVPEDECEVADCSNHGKCISGVCYCDPGWKGLHCHIEDCVDPTCSGHGVCVKDRCFCKAGWKGRNCSELDEPLFHCLPDCSGHGVYDSDHGACTCDSHWTGADCSEVLCDLDCGQHGVCLRGRCECEASWEGDLCNVRSCDPRCAHHGQCKNGTCVCMQGWNGKHCTLVGCENACNNHGRCQRVNENTEYACVCDPGWAGSDCNIMLETICDDEVDNDLDSLLDCSDSECCSQPKCRDHIMCLATNDPIEVLLRKQPPMVTASFYQRVRFLIEENSVQRYARKDEYSERFDIMVNGGGALTLQFQRSPFFPRTKTVLVPWNQIIVLDPVSMVTEGKIPEKEGSSVFQMEACSRHDYETLTPVIYSARGASSVGGYSKQTVVFTENQVAVRTAFASSALPLLPQVLQESILLPGSGVRLLYHSNQASGYFATIDMQLTPASIPFDLQLVHLKIVIEGDVIRKTFEADPNITYTLVWNKRNVYRQKVYGSSLARISVGYQYDGCKDIIWEVQTATLNGFEMDVSDIGEWNLEIHHRYNFYEGILQKGDGSKLCFKDYPRVIRKLMGTGAQRSLNCESCNGVATASPLISPFGLSVASDGTLYVGDFDLIRKVSPEGNVTTIVRLSPTRESYKYHLTISPVDGHLYISDPEYYQIYRVKDMDSFGDGRDNLESVVGSGERLVTRTRPTPTDPIPAIAISEDNILYIADGSNVRYVSSDGLMHTLIGHYRNQQQWKIVPCSSALRLEKVQLHWPIGLAVSPLDRSLHILDDGSVFKLTSDSKVRRIGNVPSHCQGDGPSLSSGGSPPHGPGDKPALGTVVSVAFAPNGDLLLADVDSKKAYTIRRLSPTRELTTVHWSEECSCKNGSCSCPHASTDGSFRAVSSIVASPSDVIYVADQVHRCIWTLEQLLPSPDENSDYHIPYPATNEVYVFNKYGQHIATKDILSGRFLYSFLYNVNTSFGKLSKVTDSSGNKLSFLRDYRNQVNSVENTQGQKCLLKMSRLGLLESLATSPSFRIELQYRDDTGLLTSRTDPLRGTFLYDYTYEGKLSSVVMPTGQILSLGSSLSQDGVFRVVVAQGGETLYTVERALGSNWLEFREGDVVSNSSTTLNGSFAVTTNFRASLKGSSSDASRFLEPSFPAGADISRPPTEQTLSVLPDLSSHVKWKAAFERGLRGGERLVRRELWVSPRREGETADPRHGRPYPQSNDSLVLSSEYDQAASRETIYNHEKEVILTVDYGPPGFPINWHPSGSSAPVKMSYDRFGRLISWSWGDVVENYTYTRQGFLAGVKYPNDGVLKISYTPEEWPSEIVVPSGRVFSFSYDRAGGLRFLTTPRGGMHQFRDELVLGFFKYSYTPPGHSKAYVQYYDQQGKLLQTVYPGNTGKVLYRYNPSGDLSEIVHGESLIRFAYSRSVLRSVHHTGAHLDFSYVFKPDGVLVSEGRVEHHPRSGLSNARFVYRYDDRFRIASVRVRIAGVELEEHFRSRDPHSGFSERAGPFRVTRVAPNHTTLFDGRAIFSRFLDDHFRVSRLSLSLQGTEIYRLDLAYDRSGRISRTRIATRNAGVSSYMNAKNYTYDADGQLVHVDAQEPWHFAYDDNGNLQSLSYRGNVIPMEYSIEDRIVRFGEGEYRYDARGFVVENAREEHFLYDARGMLARASKRNRFDVRYFYDYRGRLIARKDSQENVTQFFYADLERPHQLTHAYSPRSGELSHFLYDEDGRLVAIGSSGGQKYYVAADQCGTPLIVFDQRGEAVRETVRSPYGHIVYDSNPHFFNPVDFCGGILDPQTMLVFLEGGRLYDPLVGHWMTPRWEDVLSTSDLTKFHLYRFNGNDPINTVQDRRPPTDHTEWLRRLGYDVDLALFRPAGSGPAATPRSFFEHHVKVKWQDALPARPPPRRDSAVRTASAMLSRISQSKFSPASVPSVSSSIMRSSPDVVAFARPVSRIGLPLGDGVIVSRVDGMAVVSSAPNANPIYRDVFTSVLNQSHFLDVHSLAHTHVVFYFAKDTLRKLNDDVAQLKRLGGLVNVTTSDHEGREKHMDLRIHCSNLLLHIRYGTTYEHEKHRVLKHARRQVVKIAWTRERQLLSAGHPGTASWSKEDAEEILRLGYASRFEAEYRQDVGRYPELADDVLNVEFRRKNATSRILRKRSGEHHRQQRRRRRRRHAFLADLCLRPSLRSFMGPACSACAGRWE